MNDEYDVIVIGAGNSGLVSALTLQKAGKSVLVLEKNRMPGGVATSFKRGRFEFETYLHQLSGFGSDAGELYHLFKRLGIENKIQLNEMSEAFRILTLDTKEDYIMPAGVEEFINAMESYVPKSKESMITFFELCSDLRDGFHYLKEKGQELDINEFMDKYPNFVQVAPYSAQEVLKYLHIPSRAIDILSSYWMYLGSPISEVSFVHFALFVDSYIRFKPCMPTFTSHELSIVLETEFKNNGGEILYLRPAKEIVVEDNQVVGVATKNKVYRTHHVISSVSPTVVYGKMIKKEDVPSVSFALQNSRILGPRKFCVYLGLNKSPKELGLTNDTYFITHTLDSDKEFKRMSELMNGNIVATVVNNGNFSSYQGVTEVFISTFVNGDVFSKKVSLENYLDLKEEIAEKMISSFENATHISIREAIEEIEIATPVTFARYLGSPEGADGYLAKGYDNLLSRYLNEDNEVFIKGLRFCGAFGSFLTGYEATYLSGEDEALKTIRECE